MVASRLPSIERRSRIGDEKVRPRGRIDIQHNSCEEPLAYSSSFSCNWVPPSSLLRLQKKNSRADQTFLLPEEEV